MNGERTYSASRSPFGEELGSFSKIKIDREGKPMFELRNEWRCTAKPGKLYIHIFQWPWDSRLTTEERVR